MGNYSEARRSMFEDEAQCPNPTCRAKNVRGKHVIKFDVHNDGWCSACGFEGPMEDFQPKEPRP